MSKCTILVDLDEPERQYAPGDTVRGVVTVTVNRDCTCNALNVELCWKTHGRGNLDSATSAHDIPFEGEWSAGTEHRYPFEFTVPDGPYTYHGHLLNVDWYVRASADIPWAVDPSGEADFLVGAGPHSDATAYINSEETHEGISRRRAKESASSGSRALFGLIFAFAGGFSMFVSLSKSGDSPSVCGFLFGLIFFGVGVYLGYLGVRNSLAKIRLGKIDVEFPLEFLLPGQAVPVEVHLDASAREHLNEVSAKLVCREQVVSGSGTNKSIHSEDVFEASKELVEAVDTAGAGRLAMQTTFHLPESAAPSFYADQNELLWLVEVHVDVASWPDFKRECYLEVRPPAGTNRLREVSEDEPAIESGAVW